MHIDDDFAWGNRDRSWSVRLEEALWLDRNERWEEARQALRVLPRKQKIIRTKLLLCLLWPSCFILTNNRTCLQLLMKLLA